MLTIHLLPLAAAAAVSPALFGASVEILVAFGSRGARMLLCYLLGAAAVVVGAGTLALVLPKRQTTAGDSSLSDVVDIVLGAILVAVGVTIAFRRPRNDGKDGRAKRLLTSPWASMGVFILGILMMITNVSTLVLILAGAHEAFSATVEAAARVLNLGLLALGALAPILGPLLWVTVRPVAAARQLQRVNAFLAKFGRKLGMVVCVLTGSYLLAHGLGLI